jgi:hypothetical protein
MDIILKDEEKPEGVLQYKTWISSCVATLPMGLRCFHISSIPDDIIFDIIRSPAAETLVELVVTPNLWQRNWNSCKELGNVCSEPTEGTFPLKVFKIPFWYLEDEDIKPITQFVKRCTKLEVLHFPLYSNEPERYHEDFVDCFTTLTNLKNVYIDMESDDLITVLVKKSGETLEKLRCRTNFILSEESFLSLARLPLLKQLYGIANCWTNDKVIKFLMERAKIDDKVHMKFGAEDFCPTEEMEALREEADVTFVVED